MASTSIPSPPTWDAYKQKFSSILPNYPRAYMIARHLIESDWANTPNILLYAPVGFPMSLFTNYILVEKFGNATRNLHQSSIPFVETPFYFEIDLLHPNIKTLDTVGDFIHTIVSRSNVLMNQRHIFLLQNVDALEEEKYAFRVLLERFSRNVIFLCTTTRISAIETPLRSRFVTWTIPALTLEEIQNTMKELKKEIHPYLRESRNLLKVIMVSDMPAENITEAMCKLRYPPIQDFLKKKPYKVEEIRVFAFKLCSLNISLIEVAYDILTLMKSDEAKYAFTQRAAILEHQFICTNGGRKPLYYESILYEAIEVLGSIPKA